MEGKLEEAMGSFTGRNFEERKLLKFLLKGMETKDALIRIFPGLEAP